MKHFYNNSTQSFYIDEINEIPADSIEITAEQHNELYLAINAGCIIFDDLTYSDAPPSSFHKWNKKNKKWILDEDAKNEHLIKSNQNLKNSLINEANEKISLLQDIIDLDMQEADEEAQLKAWKKYRILVTRVDASDVNAVFPVKPE
ncbi:tail fiber assembly protein [Gilliamella intestini]|uniref:Virus tail fibre assembly protein, lambda gpK n=1 Tax=Gilliamella intestini TaxID=1798183 RepID=A0A1C4ALE2_9GAMM|nr:tail fiber assembly protein [Gilliamella intestini]SCB95502.1 virus tail fibre assembly protein, lambda gpK [Gilliamella intestini]